MVQHDGQIPPETERGGPLNKLDDDLFVDTPPPADDLFVDTPAPPPKSLAGFGKNLYEDVKGTAKAIAGPGGLGNQLLDNPLKAGVNLIKGLPHAVVEEGKRIGVGELITGHPVRAAEKFGEAAYEKPLTTTLDVLPAIGAAGKALGFGGKAAKGAEIGAQAAKLGPKVAEMAPEAAAGAAGALPEIAGGAKTGAAHAIFDYVDDFGPGGTKRNVYTVYGDPADPAVKAAGYGSSLPKADLDKFGIPITGKRAGTKFSPLAEEPPPAGAPPEAPPTAPKEPLGELQDFLAQKYDRMGKTPGAAQNFGAALEQKARGMRLKEIGGSPGQIRTLRDRFGEQAVNDLADLAERKGITKGFFNWQTGKEIQKLKETAGANIGAVRDLAVKRGAAHDPEALVKAIRAELDPIYLTGSGSSQKGPYLKALQDIKNSGGGAQQVADTITKVNKFVKKNKLTQPLGATSDVMNTASRLNNDLIGKFLNPEEAAFYKDQLKDFSAAKVFDKMYGYTYGRDMAGRSGPASPLNFIKDVGGRKIMEKVYTKMGRTMQKTPGAFEDPAALSSDVLDAIDEALDEVIDQMGSQPSQGMAHGGVVGRELGDFLAAKYE